MAQDWPVRQLDLAGTATLIASILPDGEPSREFVDLVYRQTDGNPFFIGELVRALGERGALVRHAGLWTCDATSANLVPGTVQDAIRERVGRLSASARTLLSEASVLGQVFAFDDLDAATDHPDDEVDHAMREALEAGILRPGTSDTYSFNHALTQRVLYAALTPGRRRRLHLAAAHAIQGQTRGRDGDRAAELTWHFQEGGDLGEAVRSALPAGDHAHARYAHREAARYYRIAADGARALGDTPREALARERLGRALTNDAQFVEAETVLAAALALSRELGDGPGEIAPPSSSGRSSPRSAHQTRGIEIIREPA